MTGHTMKEGFKSQSVLLESRRDTSKTTACTTACAIGSVTAAAVKTRVLSNAR